MSSGFNLNRLKVIYINAYLQIEEIKFQLDCILKHLHWLVPLGSVEVKCSSLVDEKLDILGTVVLK